MQSYRHILYIVSAFLLLPFFNFAQVPNLGIAGSFAVFTSVGAFNNDGSTIITGDIGTNVGAFSGFPPGVVIGSIHVADPVSAQAAVDVSLAYSYLDALTCGTVLTATIGNNQVLSPDIYCIGSAAVLNGNLILDGEGDPNARFIFQIDGALSTSTLASITLINNASICNVYWQVNGAFDLGEGSNFVGTILANGAISLLEGSSLEGRALTQAGAVDLHTNVVSLPEPPQAATITADGATSFCLGDSVVLSGNGDGIWSTGDTSFSITVTASGTYSVSNTNDCGIAVSNEITVTVEPDITPPVLTCPADITINCDESVLPAITGSATAADDCDPNPVITYSDQILPGFCIDNSEIIRTWDAIDMAGNDTFCVQNITILDLSAPVITCPADVQLTCTDPTTPDATGFATAIDNCDTTPEVSFLDVTNAGLCPDSYTIIRTWTASDNCSNTTQCVQNITVLDNTAPIITCPAAISILCTEEILPIVTGVATAIDLCDAAPVVNYTDVVTPSVECVQNYVISRTWTATDVCGNTSTCLQTITVLDNVAPVIFCPASLSVECADQILPVDVSQIIVTDNCGNITITFTGEEISNEICENNFLLTRTFLATDDCGNTATCQQLISVLDTVPPTITFTDPRLINLNDMDTLVIQCYGQDPPWALPVFTINSINASDICEGDITLTYEKALLAEGDCLEDGFIQMHELTWTAIDICGNANSITLIMKLVDNIAPVILGVPDDITIDCESLIELPLNIIALDECLCACVMVSEQTNIPTGCQDGVVITITWTATDDCGNTTTEYQNITLIDTIGPVIEIVHPDIYGIENGTVMEVGCDEDGFPRFVMEMDKESVTGLDICGGSVLVVFNEEIIVTSDCKTTGILEERIFLWTVTDLCGNQSTFTFTVRMIDTIPPVWVGVPDTVCLGSELLNGIYATDDCIEPYTNIKDFVIDNPCGSGTAVERRFRATDECGNTAVAKTIIIPIEEYIPEIQFINPLLINLLPGEVINANCEVQNGQFTAFGIEDVYVEGVCVAGATITFTEQVIATPDCSEGGIKAVVSLTWTVEDICGNTASRTITANVVDDTPPVFENFDAEVTIGCNDSLPTIIAYDLCGSVFVTYRDTIMPTNCIYNYDVVRLITATDECGNTMTREQVVHVGGGAGPIISGVEDSIICDDLTIPAVTAYDACTDQFVPVSMTEDTVDVICIDGLVIIRTWTAQDTCGRQTVITQTIVMNDHTPPVITVPGNSVLYPFWNGQKTSIYLWQFAVLNKLKNLDAYSVNVDDDCDQDIIPVFTVHSIFPDDCEAAGYYERRVYTWIATDICDNADTLIVTVDIIDDIAPEFLDFPSDLTIYCVPLPPVPDLIVEDYTQSVSLVFTEEILPGNEEGVFIVIRTWIATDACGNSTKKVQTITWIPDNEVACEIIIPENVSCNSHEVLIHSIISGGAGIIDYTWVIEGEKCFIQGGQGTPWIKIYVGWSPVKITLTTTDSLGCISVCTAILACVSAANADDDGGSNVGFTPLPDLQWELNSTQANGVEIEDLKMWPNPASNAVNLNFQATGETTLTVNILNPLGVTVYSGKLDVKGGSNIHRIDLPVTYSGNYIMQVVSDQHIYIRHLVIIQR